MTKHELLAQLPAYPNNPTALALAKLGLSDDSVKTLAGRLERRQTWASRASTLSFVLSVAAVLLLLIGDESLTPLQVAGTLGTVGASLVLHVFLVSPLNMLPQLAPLRGTPLCEDALALVKTGGPTVAAWRSLALSERDQLYCFDYNIMYCLGAAHQATQDNAERQAAIEVACRELHEIA